MILRRLYYYVGRIALVFKMYPPSLFFRRPKAPSRFSFHLETGQVFDRWGLQPVGRSLNYCWQTSFGPSGWRLRDFSFPRKASERERERGRNRDRKSKLKILFRKITYTRISASNKKKKYYLSFFFKFFHQSILYIVTFSHQTFN